MAIFLLVQVESVSYSQTTFNPDSLRQLTVTEDDDRVRLEAFMELSKAYLAEAFYDSSARYSDSAISIATAIKDQEKLAEITYIKGNALFYGVGPDAGIILYKESYRLYNDMGDSAGMVKALNGIGVMYKKMAQYDSALAIFIRLVTIAERNGYEQTLGMGYVNIGILYQDYLDLDRAAHYLALSIPINEKYRPDLVGLAHLNMGLVKYERQQYDSALAELRIARAIFESLDSRKFLADALNSFGNVYFALNDMDSSYHYYSAANRIYGQQGNVYEFSQTLNNLALVDLRNGNYEQAIRLLDSCLAITTINKNRELEMLAHKNKFLVFVRKSDYKRALESYVVADSLEDIIFSLDKQEKMADLEMKYQNEIKQAEILRLERDNLRKTKQNNAYLFTGLGLIALIIFAFLYYRQRAVKDRIIAAQKIRQLEEEKKLMAARSLVEGQEEERKRIALELHDGLGVLLSATRMQFSVLGETSPSARSIVDKASRLLEQASSDVRKISHNMMPGLLTKLGLFEALADLFEGLQEAGELKVYAEIPEHAGRLPENREIMIFRIVQELVNNTLKHAGASRIDFHVDIQPGQLEIFYADDGKGFDPEEMLHSKSMGLSSMRSRVDFLNGSMNIRSEPGKGAEFRFTIPV